MRPTIQVLYRVLSDAAGKLVMLAITLYAARVLAPPAFGVFALGATAGWIAAVLSDGGIQLHLARAVAQSPGRATTLLRYWWKVRTKTTLAAAALSALAITATGAPLSDALAASTFVAAYLVAGMIDFLNHFYRGAARTDIESSLTLVHRAGALILVTAGLAFFASPLAIAAAMFGAALPAAAWSWRRASTLAEAIEVDAGDAVVPAPAATYRHDVLPIGLGIALSAVYFRIDVLLVGAWLDPAAAGSYNAVFRLVEALRLLPAAVLAVGLPVLARASGLRPVTRLAFLLVAAGLGVTAVLTPFAPMVVERAFGVSYLDAVPAFRILLIAFPLMALNYALSCQVLGWGGNWAYAATCGVALIVNLVLNAILIPAWALIGAAWTTFWTEVAVTAGCTCALWWFARRQRSTARGAPALEVA